MYNSDILSLKKPQFKILKNMAELLMNAEYENGVSGYDITMRKNAKLSSSTWNENHKDLEERRIIIPVLTQAPAKKKNSKGHKRPKYTYKISQAGYLLLSRESGPNIENVFKYFPQIKMIFDELRMGLRINEEFLKRNLLDAIKMIDFRLDGVQRILTVVVTVPYNNISSLVVNYYLTEDKDVTYIIRSLFLYNLFKIHYDYIKKFSVWDVIRDLKLVEGLVKEYPGKKKEILQGYHKLREIAMKDPVTAEVKIGKEFIDVLQMIATGYERYLRSNLNYSPEDIKKLIDHDFITKLTREKNGSFYALSGDE